MKNPRFKAGDYVMFSTKWANTQYAVCGQVYIVDRWGTFEQNVEPSYDVMSVGLDGQECLYKHIRESQLIEYKDPNPNPQIELKSLKVHKNDIHVINQTQHCVGDYVIVVKNPQVDKYSHWTTHTETMTEEMETYVGQTARIVDDCVWGYTLDIDEGEWYWTSDMLKSANDGEDPGKVVEPVEDGCDSDDDSPTNNQFKEILRSKLEALFGGKISDEQFNFIMMANDRLLCSQRNLEEFLIATFNLADYEGKKPIDLINDLNAYSENPTAEIVVGDNCIEIYGIRSESDEEFINQIFSELVIDNLAYIKHLESKLTNR